MFQLICFSHSIKQERGKWCHFLYLQRYFPETALLPSDFRAVPWWLMEAHEGYACLVQDAHIQPRYKCLKISVCDQWRLMRAFSHSKPKRTSVVRAVLSSLGMKSRVGGPERKPREGWRMRTGRWGTALSNCWGCWVYSPTQGPLWFWGLRTFGARFLLYLLIGYCKTWLSSWTWARRRCADGIFRST